MTRYFGDGNLANYKNNEATEILKDIYNISDEKIYKEKYERLQEIYEDERPYIGLYFSRMAIIANKNLKIGTNQNWFNVYHNINNWYKK